MSENAASQAACFICRKKTNPDDHFADFILEGYENESCERHRYLADGCYAGEFFALAKWFGELKLAEDLRYLITMDYMAAHVFVTSIEHNKNCGSYKWGFCDCKPSLDLDEFHGLVAEAENKDDIHTADE